MAETPKGDMGGGLFGVKYNHGHNGKHTLREGLAWDLANASVCGHVWLKGGYGLRALEQVAQCLTSNNTSRL